MESLPRTSGVYKITCMANGKVYIGSTENLWVRWRAHLRHLQRGSHANRNLQNAWRTYGATAFVCEVVELVLVSFIYAREQYWLDKLNAANPDHGFNHHPNAESAVGYTRSAEQRAKQSETMRRLMADPARRAAVSRVHKGKIISPEQRAQNSANLKGRKRPESAVMPMRQAWEAKHGRAYIVTAPNGTEYMCTNLTAFCCEHGLKRGLKDVLAGKCRQYQGWRVRYAD